MNLYRVDSLGSWGWVTDSYHNTFVEAKECAQASADTTGRKYIVRDPHNRLADFYVLPRQSNKPTMPNPFTTFYIIWSPTGPTPPRSTHYSRAEADKVCQAMAGRHPRQEFYVMEAKARAKVNNVEFVEASQSESYNPF